MEDRRWIPAWRFQPLRNMNDAFKLLGAVAGTFTLTSTADRAFSASVRAGCRVGKACGKSGPGVITVAVARAIGLTVPDDLAESVSR
jgi:hypothetical protein